MLAVLVPVGGSAAGSGARGGMEALAVSRGRGFETLSLAAQELLWQEMKRGE